MEIKNARKAVSRNITRKTLKFMQHESFPVFGAFCLINDSFASVLLLFDPSLTGSCQTAAGVLYLPQPDTVLFRLSIHYICYSCFLPLFTALEKVRGAFGA